MSQTYILFHENCADGTASALTAYLKFGEDAIYIPVQYNQPLPDLKPKSTVYVLDFCYPRQFLDDLIDTYNQDVIVLDHHKTAQEALLGYSKLKDSVFDMTKSGAILSWEYFHPADPVPSLFYYIQDRDLWQWKYPQTKFISAYLSAVGFNNFRDWIPFLEESNLDNIIDKGEAISEYQDKSASSNGEKFYEGILPDGTIMWMLNNQHLISDTCHKFLIANENIKVCCCWFVVDGSKVVFSFRSKQEFDCSEIAKKLGGGGHKNAAGASVNLTEKTIPKARLLTSQHSVQK
ncbi:UNVERIFIED_CONTAM: hypothetical protein BEN50_11080 [Euhalothece sp. KZN 001]